MEEHPKKQGKVFAKTGRKTHEVEKKSYKSISKKTEAFIRSTSEMIIFTPKTAWDARKMIVSWGNQQIPGWYALLTKAIKSSKLIGTSTGKAILEYVSSAHESAGRGGKKVINHTAIFTNAILASDFSRNMESWLGHMFNEGIPSIYDKAADAVYIATHIGGGHLHRLFDSSHTLWGMWDKVKDASPDDSFLQEIVGYTTALGKDLSSSVGIPLFDWSKSSYDQVASALNSTFHIPKSWFSDLLHVNTTELIGTSIGTIAVALNWNKKQVREFSSLAGSLGISSIASANPVLAVVALTALAKSFADAKQKGDYSEFVNGLAKGGVGTGAFLATASAIGGPVWVGLLAGTCVGAVVHKTMGTVQVSQISTFIENSMRRGITEKSSMLLQTS
ncbi:MAG: hypothetical protein JRI46_01375 [Deltaproteobacteria bacterium]|nr:hypothetical protein [Deltaproteobacteria bacterium]